MRQIGAFEAKNKLSALLDQVEHGEEILITRHGRPVAKLSPAAPSFDRDKARRVADALRKMSDGLTLDGLSVKELTVEGRA